MRCGNLLAAATLLLSVTAVQAKVVDLGVQGAIHKIAEPDIRAVLMQQVANIDLSKKQKKLEDQARHYGKNLPNLALPVAEQTHTYFITPSATVTKTIYYPDLDGHGRLKWKVLAKKGTRVNPLKTARPTDAFLVFNANDKSQVAFMQALVKKSPHYIRPLASAGDPTKLAKKMDMPVFRASPYILKRFDLAHEPALVRAGEGAHKLQLAVTVFARPFGIERALKDVPMKQLLGFDHEHE